MLENREFGHNARSATSRFSLAGSSLKGLTTGCFRNTQTATRKKPINTLDLITSQSLRMKVMRRAVSSDEGWCGAITPETPPKMQIYA
jgi:hypothetical protein